MLCDVISSLRFNIGIRKCAHHRKPPYHHFNQIFIVEYWSGECDLFYDLTRLGIVLTSGLWGDFQQYLNDNLRLYIALSQGIISWRGNSRQVRYDNLFSVVFSP